ncbi:hypothetical protein [Embleya sp. AB8]|uniref:hypothetical protein n=1 Tax=Embleya sp. AB8 TaxID=3156304 RepID=UPI003C730B76
MQSQTQRRATPPSIRNAVTTMYVGVTLTLVSAATTVAMAGPLGDRLRDVYPDYDDTRLESVKSSVLTYLFTIATVGIAMWLWMAWASKRGKRWTRTVATSVFTVASAISVYNFTQPQPTLVNLAGLLPCVAGLATVGFLWRRDSSAHFSAGGGTAD